MKKTVKLTALLLVFILAFSLVSCGEEDREYNAEEVAAAAKALLEKSILLNEIYYGEGIPYDITVSEGDYRYKPADFVWLDQNGFQTVDELKEMTTKVYTNSFSEGIFSAKLGSMTDAMGNIESYARYVQVFESDAPTEPKHILVDMRAEPLFVCENEFLYDTLTVTHSKGERVYISIDVKVTKQPEEDWQDPIERTKNLTLPLIEESPGEWRLGGTTFINII